MNRRSLVLILGIMALSLSSPLVLRGQQPIQLAQLADRGPLFFARTESGKLVDARAAATLRKRISVDLENVSISDAITEIGRAAGLVVSFSGSLADLSRRTSLKAKGITVEAALTDVLVDVGLDVELLAGRRAMLVRHVNVVPQPNLGTIVGRVTDSKSGQGMQNATVTVETTNKRATTDTDGKFAVRSVRQGAYNVTARFLGYTPLTKQIQVRADSTVRADFALEKSVSQLDQVVVTGTVVPTAVKALPTPISIISADDIQRQNLQRVDQVFRGEVPGTIAWDFGPLDWSSTVSVRGASTISAAPTIKTFIDGVEMADPTFIAAIDPNSIDRIEITRGPQASTLYGAGALDGVMQIFTKKGQFGLARPEVTGKISAGAVGGFDGQGTAFRTDNAMSVLGGGERTGYNLTGSYRHTGEWVPSYNSTDWGLSAGGQATQGLFTLSGSARYGDKTFDDPWDARFQSYTFFSRPFYQTQRLRHETYGTTASLQATQSWQHTLTLGYDQSYFEFDQTRPRFTTPDDSLLRVSAYHEAKTSLLYHTDLNLQLGAAASTVVTAGVNYDAYDYVSAFTSGATRTTGNLNGSTFAQRTPWNTTGYFGQAEVNFADRLFLTGGLRAERNTNFGADFGTAWSPRVGAAYVQRLGPATAKLRASYGESIRAPVPGQREGAVLPFSITLANPALAPERQRGGDGGIELYVRGASLAVTYYTQRAIDLIQSVTILTAPGPLPTYQNQNVGRVKNEGWEFEGHLPVGPVQLAGTYSITNSNIQELAPGYTGDYHVGDRVFDIPHTSAGATITYSPLPQTTLTASMTYIGYWTDYDYLALYGYFFGGQPYRGSNRAYWINYPAVTKFAVGANQVLMRGVTAFVRAENVGNNLRYELNSSNIPMPRSVVLGANFHY